MEGTSCRNAATVIDNTDDCFSLAGPTQHWRSEAAGYDGDMAWTRSTISTEFNSGTWTLDFEEAGRYGLQVYVDENHTEAAVAKYAVTHADGTTDEPDQLWIVVEDLTQKPEPARAGRVRVVRHIGPERDQVVGIMVA